MLVAELHHGSFVVSEPARELSFLSLSLLSLMGIAQENAHVYWNCPFSDGTYLCLIETGRNFPELWYLAFCFHSRYTVRTNDEM